jgi:DNA repair exonuclease SbcCD ATPase subunit
MSVEKLQREISKWEARLSKLQQKAEQAMARANALEEERRALALAAAEGDEKAEKAMNRKAAEADEARRQSDNFGLMGRQAEGKLATLREELADAQRQELLGTLRQACEKRNGAVQRLGHVVQKELTTLVAELKSSADEIAEVSEQLNAFDRGTVRDLLFRAPLGFLVWAVNGELERLGESDRLAGLNFTPRDGHRERPLEAHQEWVCTDFFKAAERSIQGAKLARERARGLIRVEEGEQLYRARHRIMGVRGLNLEPGELIALRPDEAGDLAEAVEPTDEVPEQEQVA